MGSGKSSGKQEGSRWAERQSGRRKSQHRATHRGARGPPEPGCDLTSGKAGGVPVGEPAPHGLLSGASLPAAKGHMLPVETGLFGVPNVITVINRSPKDQQRDLSLFRSNETPQQEQLNTPETQGRHPIPGAVLAPVTKPRSQEGPQTSTRWTRGVHVGVTGGLQRATPRQM